MKLDTDMKRADNPANSYLVYKQHVKWRVLLLLIVFKYSFVQIKPRRDDLAGTATRYILGGSGIEPRWEQEIFSSLHPSRTPLGPTQHRTRAVHVGPVSAEVTNE